MKKKFLTFILTIATMLICIFGLSACGDKEISFKLIMRLTYIIVMMRIQRSFPTTTDILFTRTAQKKFWLAI